MSDGASLGTLTDSSRAWRLVPAACVCWQLGVIDGVFLMHDDSMSPRTVLAFWREAGPAQWFAKSDTFDAAFRDRFMAAHMAAARRQLDDWAGSADGALALLILLDQWPRNAFRGTAHMFATDPLARSYASAMIEAGQDGQIETGLRAFCYLPLEHAEDLALQHRCVALMTPLGGQSLAYAEHHAAIIERFGRFPHRNPLLGRTSSREELDYLAAGGFAG